MVTDPSCIFDWCYQKALGDTTNATHPEKSGALDGLRVLETATVLAGPAVGMFLAECGARVLKLEPLTGDVTRQWTLAHEAPAHGQSAYFCSVNWGKASLLSALDRQNERDILHRLITEADILITNNLPRQEKALGLDWETLHAINPRLLVGRINGYGAESSRPGYDSLVQAESGYVSMNGPHGGPGHKMPVALMDVLAAHQLKEGLLLGLLQRGTHGLGREIRVSLLDSGLASLSNQATNWWMGGVEAVPMGSEHPNIVPYGSTFCCRDGQWLTLAVGNNTQFEAACDTLQLELQAQWATPSGRLQDKTNLLAHLQKRFSLEDRAHWLHALEANRVPAAPVNSLSQALEQPAALRLKLSEGGLNGLRTAVFEGVNESPLPMKPPPPLPVLTLSEAANGFRA